MLRVAVKPMGDGEYQVFASRSGRSVLSGEMEIGERPQGPRPTGFRVDGDGDAAPEPRDPQEFVELARMADELLIPERASVRDVGRFERAMDAYQLDVRPTQLCRHCLLDGEINEVDSGVEHSGEEICVGCGRREFRREAEYAGLSREVRENLDSLLRDVGSVGKLVDLLEGSVDPELTRFDTVEATEDVDEVQVTELELDSRLEDAVGFDSLLPVQSRAVEAGVLDGEDVLVVSSTATGKTLIGELAGVQNTLEGRGKMLYLAPLVALANQKHQRFKERYPFVDVTLKVGSNRLSAGGSGYDADADVVVGTYEGFDHALRTGRGLGEVGTVVVDEVHEIEDESRGPELDGTITRLRHRYPDAQWVYLSATVGDARGLGRQLDARVVEHSERPVSIERHLTFASSLEKKDIVDRLVKREFNRKSSKGYRGQSIVFTNSRRRCHELAGAMDASAVAYHAGLSGGERGEVERRFEEGDVAAVVTTAALGAGVDFPASQVVFERLAMGIEWLSVQEFEQMLGRAGRPDYHDRGVVYVLAEPDAVYHGSMERTEDEVALDLLRGDVESTGVTYTFADDAEQTLANVAAAGDGYRRLNEKLLGNVDTERAVEKLNEEWLLRDDEITGVGEVAAEKFLEAEEAGEMARLIEGGAEPMEVVAELEVDEDPD